MIEDEGIAPALADGVGEAKAYLRVEGGGEDAAIAGLLGSAAGMAEAFLRQALIVRGFRETLAADATWRRLGRSPVRSISAVEAIAEDGTVSPLPVGSYAIDIEAAGEGRVRVTDPAGAKRVAVNYMAGIAADWAGIEAAVRQGMIRLVAHLYAHRDAIDDPGPPPLVTALWAPFRRRTLR